MSFLSFTTPTNIAREREKFFRDAHYEPQFVYDWDRKKIDRYLKTKEYYRPLVEAMLQKNHKAITHEAQKLFQVQFSAEAEHEALGIVQQNNKIPTPQKHEVVKAIQSAITFFDIPYTLREVPTEGFRFRPHHPKKELQMSASMNLEWVSADSLAKHEITHLIRAVNTKHNAIPEAPDYLPTEEGLASLMADDYANESFGSRHQHAIEYLAAQTSATGSLRDVFAIFRQYGFQEHGAWQRAIRHKFGFCDTGEPGGFMKPAMYFLWRLTLKKLSSEELLRLFVGKISVDQLIQVPVYRGRIPKEKILSFFHLT